MVLHVLNLHKSPTKIVVVSAFTLFMYSHVIILITHSGCITHIRCPYKIFIDVPLYTFSEDGYDAEEIVSFLKGQGLINVMVTSPDAKPSSNC